MRTTRSIVSRGCLTARCHAASLYYALFSMHEDEIVLNGSTTTIAHVSERYRYR
jgi:hypothetical protein